MSSRFELLVHPVRLQILHAFGAGDLRLTHDELAARLEGMAPATMEKHLDILLHSGIIEVADKGGEREYSVVKGETFVSSSDIRKATPADHLRYFTTFVAGLIESFAGYIRRPNADIAEAGISYRQVTLHLTPDELRRLMEEIEVLFRRDLQNPPGGDRKPMVVSRIILPEVHPTNELPKHEPDT
jgi:DNA-binding transcriptional ArsR family regulator